MSIEYFGNPYPRFTEEQAESLLSALCTCEEWTVRRRTEMSAGLDVRGVSPNEWEMVTLEIGPDRVYIGFQGVNSGHRNRLLRWLSSRFNRLGIKVSLEEE